MGANLIGVVLNAVPIRRRGYYYYYANEYGLDETRSKGKRGHTHWPLARFRRWLVDGKRDRRSSSRSTRQQRG